MSTVKEIIVVSVPRQHPSGQRNRAGFQFFEKPKAVLVTAEQKEQIESDQYLKIHRRLHRSWFEALGLQYNEENIKKYADKEPETQLSKLEGYSDDMSVQTPSKLSDSDEGAKTSGNASNEAHDDANKDAGSNESSASGKLGIAVSKNLVIAKLKEKGQIEGKDFAADASRDDLVALYNSLV